MRASGGSLGLHGCMRRLYAKPVRMASRSDLQRFTTLLTTASVRNCGSVEHVPSPRTSAAQRAINHARNSPAFRLWSHDIAGRLVIIIELELARVIDYAIAQTMITAQTGCQTINVRDQGRAGGAAELICLGLSRNGLPKTFTCVGNKRQNQSVADFTSLGHVGFGSPRFFRSSLLLAVFARVSMMFSRIDPTAATGRRWAW